MPVQSQILAKTGSKKVIHRIIEIRTNVGGSVFTYGMESNEAQGGEDTHEPEPTLAAVVADTCSAMLDAVAVIDRIEAKQDAWKVEFIDQARQIAEMTNHGIVTVGSTLTEGKQREMVRRSFVAEVACVLRVPEPTAGQLIDDSEALMHRLPLTLRALRDGEISLRHARVIVDNVSTLDQHTAQVLEETALPYAKTLTVSRFSHKARILRERLDAESIVERTTRSAKDRRVEFLPARDGMAWFSLYTTAPEALALFTGVRETAMRLQNKNETRTLAQLAADVCADALAAGLDSGRSSSDNAQATTASTNPDRRTAFSRITSTVVVTVPVQTLMGQSDEPGDLAGYGPIDPETARRLAGQSRTWMRLLTDPDTGAPLSLGRVKYKPTKQMRAYLTLRDGTCRFEGCNRQSRQCEIDHTRAWEHGGPTDCDNLAHLCPKHHRLKHETTWRVKQRGGGSLEWTSPDGRTYMTEPEMTFSTPRSARESKIPPPPRVNIAQPRAYPRSSPPTHSQAPSQASPPRESQAAPRADPDESPPF